MLPAHLPDTLAMLVRKEGVEPSSPRAHGSEPCVFTVSPLALVGQAGLEPA